MCECPCNQTGPAVLATVTATAQLLDWTPWKHYERRNWPARKVTTHVWREQRLMFERMHIASIQEYSGLLESPNYFVVASYRSGFPYPRFGCYESALKFLKDSIGGFGGAP